MMNRLRDDLAKAQQQKIEAEERADRWEKIKSVRRKSTVLCVFCSVLRISLLKPKSFVIYRSIPIYST